VPESSKGPEFDGFVLGLLPVSKDWAVSLLAVGDAAAKAGLWSLRAFCRIFRHRIPICSERLDLLES
jgi:hypothetical protein